VDKDEFEKVQEIVADGIEAAGLDEVVLSAEESAAKRLADTVSDEAVDRMIADAKETGIPLLDGPDGLIGQLTARIIERALGAEMDDHLGYEEGDPAGRGTGNSRNGHYGKTVTTQTGPVRISVPRDRNSEFEPRIVKKGRPRGRDHPVALRAALPPGISRRTWRRFTAPLFRRRLSRVSRTWCKMR
jgi:putative transposase